MAASVYTPRLARVLSVRDEVAGIRPVRTLKLEVLGSEPFAFRCGQCAMLSAFGKGESMISIASSPLVTEHLQFSILKSGRVTSAIHDLEPGAVLGIRGPYGNGFPIDSWTGRNIVVVGGGIGLAPIWSVLQTALLRRDEFGDLALFYGARTSRDLVYRAELDELRSRMTVHVSVDRAEEGWTEFVGFVAENVLDKRPSADDSVAITCGPPIMIRTVIRALGELGFRDSQIFTTVENKMKCGVGKCGRCNIGHHFICRDGPVYSWAELKLLPQEY